MLYKVYKNGIPVDGLIIECKSDDVVNKMMQFMNIRDPLLVNQTKNGLIYLNPIFTYDENLSAIEVYEIEEIGGTQI
ncbi:MAG: hypothetical protein WC261_14270 [Synergistaceae bacterium]|jgi:hypothetical protein